MNQLGITDALCGGCAIIGPATPIRARLEGADVILTGRNPERLKAAAADVGAQRTAAFDANDPQALAQLFQSVTTTIDHILEERRQRFRLVSVRRRGAQPCDHFFAYV